MLHATLRSLAWDTHTHVFGPPERYPLAPVRGYTPQVRWIDQLGGASADAGVRHVVLVHPSVYGFDLSSLTDALATGAGQYRAVAVVPPDVPAARLLDLHRLGVRGVRFNLVSIAGNTFDGFDEVAAKAADLGWHAQIFIHPRNLPDVMRLRERTAIPFVFDHFGGFRAGTDVASAAWKSLLALVRDANCWVKLSGFYRLSDRGIPYDDLDPLAQSLASASADRLVWGSDWPHTWFWEHAPGDPPQYADLIAPIARCFPDIAMQRRILVDNPERLYR
ncbi:MAG: amidohydrolase family protein [Burkholderiales bacterium]